MFFRFGSALTLVVLVSLWGIALEKQTLELRRLVARQRFRHEALQEQHAKLRLRAEQLGNPVRVLERLQQRGLTARPAPLPDPERSAGPLLRWQRPLPDGR